VLEGEREALLPLALPFLLLVLAALLALESRGLGCPEEGLVARVWRRGDGGRRRIGLHLP
jgi:hypothetical protein